MRRILTINSNGKTFMKVKPRMRRNLPYMGIARRTIKDAPSNYDREIDLSAVVIK